MPDVPTTAKALTKQVIGSHVNTWGTILNDNFDLIDKAVGQTIIRNVTGDATITTIEAECSFFTITGSATGDITLTFPTYRGFLMVRNAMLSDSIINAKISGASASVWPGETQTIYSDGIDFWLCGGAVLS